MTELLYVILDPEARDLVVEALRGDSVRRQRAATRAAAELHAERLAGDRKDIRSGAVMVTNLLVDAARLDEAAAAIATARPFTPPATIVIPGEGGGGGGSTRAAAEPQVVRPPVVDTATGSDEAASAEAAPSVPAPAADHPSTARSRDEALAETLAVINDLGLNLAPDEELPDLDDEDALDALDDGRLPEDEPDPEELTALATTPAPEA
jgi:hypothetical protein